MAVVPHYESAAPAQLDRVRLAALRIARRDVQKLLEAIRLAKTDWRDLLVAVEGNR